VSKVIEDVIAERNRQVSQKGWTADHDDQHKDGAIALAGAGYAHAAAWAVMAPSDEQFTSDDPPTPWPAEQANRVACSLKRLLFCWPNLNAWTVRQCGISATIPHRNPNSCYQEHLF